MKEDYKSEIAKSARDDEAEQDEEDFASLLESSQYRSEARIRRDAKVQGTVVSVGGEWVFLDVGGKSEGCISCEELLNQDGQLRVQVGDTVTAYVVDIRPGEIVLSTKMTSAASEDAIRGAFQSGLPVEGIVQSERKGGYAVTIFGKPAFCPYSQIDIQSGEPPEKFVGKRFSFRIIEYSDRGRNIVLSRKEILEEERLENLEELKRTLSPGDLVTGTVQKLARFGAFVDIGGVEGLVPMSELAWYRVGDVSDILTPGQEIVVRILELDWANQRISLSLKQTQEDPWASVPDRYSEGAVLTGRVTRMVQFGAFVELEPGVEGLIHISNFGTGRRINHPKEVVSEGEKLEVRVLSVDNQARRIGLELVFSGPAGVASPVPEIREGDVLVGTVDAVKDYGVFVGLPGGKSGLLHVSEMGDARKGDLRNRFPLGSSVQVEVLAIDPETKKVALSTKSLSTRMEESHFKEFATTQRGAGSLWTLGDLLKDKLKQ